LIYSGLETKQDTWITWSIFDPDCVKTPIYAKYGLHKAIC